MIQKVKEKLPPPKKIAIVVVALAVLSVGVGVAATGGFFSSSGVTWGTDSGLTVEQGQDIDGVSVTWQDSQTLTLESTTVDSSGDTWVRLDQRTGTYTRLSKINASQADIGIDPPDKNRIVVGGGIDTVDFRDASVDTGDAVFSYSAGSTASVELVQTGVTNTNVVAVASDGTVVDYGTTDSGGTLTLDQLASGSYDNIKLKTTSDPALSGATPSGGSSVSDSSLQLNINVSDPDFGATQGDSVTVEFYDASDDRSLGTDTVTANDTASATFDQAEGGPNSWYAVATDAYGNSVTSDTFSFNAPDELRIYSETEPDQLISDDTSLRVRFFVEGQETVIERETNSGIVDLEGLPVDQRFIVTVRDDQSNFTYRRIVIDSLVETQDAYLLNESEPNSQILFQLDDPTGEFPPEQTTLYVEKPITKDFNDDGTDTTRYEVMAGDTFGASAQFPIVLQDDSRYRLRVEAEDGSSRILGAYSVSGEAVEPLQIQRVNLEGDADSGASLQSTIEGPDNDRNLYVRYVDPGDETKSVEYRIIDATDGSVYVENTTRTSNSFADVYNLPATNGEMSYKVEYQIERSGNVTGGSVYAGKLPEVADRFGIEQRVLNWVSWAAILATMGLLVIVSPKIAPIGGVGMATVLTTLGAINLSAPVIGVAGAVSVLVIVGGDPT